MDTWQQIALLLIGGLIAFLFFPGVKRMLEASENAPKDWPGVLVPLALVIGFVLLLIALV